MLCCVVQEGEKTNTDRMMNIVNKPEVIIPTGNHGKVLHKKEGNNRNRNTAG